MVAATERATSIHLLNSNHVYQNMMLPRKITMFISPVVARHYLFTKNCNDRNLWTVYLDVCHVKLHNILFLFSGCDVLLSHFFNDKLAITTIGKSPKKNFYWFFCF